MVIMKDKTRITIEIPEDIKQEVKLFIANKKINIKTFITGLILEALNKQNEDYEECGYS